MVSSEYGLPANPPTPTQSRQICLFRSFLCHRINGQLRPFDGGLDVFLMVPKCREQVGDVMVVKAVKGVATVTLDVNESRLAEEAKLMRGRALGHPGEISQFIDRSFLVEHRPEQFQATAGSEESHRLREFFSLVLTEGAHGRVVFGRMSHDVNGTAWLRGGGTDA